MINRASIAQWRTEAPWNTNEEVEQDLIICRNTKYRPQSIAIRARLRLCCRNMRIARTEWRSDLRHFPLYIRHLRLIVCGRRLHGADASDRNSHIRFNHTKFCNVIFFGMVAEH